MSDRVFFTLMVLFMLAVLVLATVGITWSVMEAGDCREAGFVWVRGHCLDVEEVNP